MELTETERQAVNWGRFTVKIGVRTDENGNDGAFRFSRVELGILRNLLTKEIAGEVVAQASDNFRKLAQIITAMEQWMVDRERR